MNNKVAFALAAIAAAGLAADFGFNDGAASLFLVRKFTDLVEWVAFWR